MPKKTIKVLDVIPEVNENTPINADVESVNEPEQVIETEVKSDEKVEELPKEQIKEETIETEQETPVIDNKKKTRVQELHECPKCKKMLTKKTLTYFHECTKNDTVKAKRRPKKIIVENIKKEEEDGVAKSHTSERGNAPFEEPKEEQAPPQPKLVRQTNKVNYEPPVQLSYEDMRKQRIQQRIEQRTVKMQNLFATAI